MEFLHCTMDEFAVLGKEGSTHSSNPEWIKQLWIEANGHFDEISKLALRDDQGNLAGFWGAMTSEDRSFQPWENDLSEGLYLAGVQVSVDTEAPEGWVKWIVPAFDYLYAQVEGNPQAAIQIGLAEIERQGFKLSGAIQEYYCPQENGAMYLFFPIKQNCNEKLRKCIR